MSFWFISLPCVLKCDNSVAKILAYLGLRFPGNFRDNSKVYFCHLFMEMYGNALDRDFVVNVGKRSVNKFVHTI